MSRHADIPVIARFVDPTHSFDQGTVWRAVKAIGTAALSLARLLADAINACAIAYATALVFPFSVIKHHPARRNGEPDRYAINCPAGIVERTSMRRMNGARSRRYTTHLKRPITTFVQQARRYCGEHCAEL
jgi:hypothetical protein